eukprot:GHVP01048948.1.p1 GENE.GHVP01048948.1~~GHVP01048948.1.p1  ORF type:complete len:302 (+),score=45.59 GHVP01048948.1:51-956(+)
MLFNFASIVFLVAGQQHSSLKRAIDAAYVKILRDDDFPILQYGHIPVSLCNPAASWEEPDEGINDIISRGKITVAVLEENWGDDGDYTTDPPTGYFPDLIRMVATTLSKFYDLDETLSVSYRKFSTSSEVFESLKNQDTSDPIDFTCPSFLISGLYTDALSNEERARLQDFEFACPIVGTPAILLLDEESEINSMSELRVYIYDNGGIVVVITEGNKHLIQPLLPRAQIKIVTPTEACEFLNNGTAVAGFQTGVDECQSVKRLESGATAIHTSFLQHRGVYDEPGLASFSPMIAITALFVF